MINILCEKRIVGATISRGSPYNSTLNTVNRVKAHGKFHDEFRDFGLVGRNHHIAGLKGTVKSLKNVSCERERTAASASATSFEEPSSDH